MEFRRPKSTLFYLFRIKEKPRLQSNGTLWFLEMPGFSRGGYSYYLQTIKEIISQLTAIFFTTCLTSSAFGIVMFKTPSLNFALILSSSISEVSSKQEIPFLRVSDLVWTEIDNQSHYDRAINKIYPRIIQQENIQKGGNE